MFTLHRSLRRVIPFTGAVLQSMIRSGLKDDTLDLAQVWKQMFTLASPNTTQSTPTTATTEG